MKADAMPQFPGHAHRPGVTASPDSQWLQAAKGMLDDAALVEKGIELLRAGYFWECHELLEKAWLARTPNTPEREMLRAIIQIANGLLKYTMDRPGAAARLFQESKDILAALDPAQPVFRILPASLQASVLAAGAAMAVHNPELPGQWPEQSEEGVASASGAIAHLQRLKTCSKMQNSSKNR